MKCPFCSSEQDKVVDSRTSKEGTAVRRRRECNICHRRFTTYEYVENVSHLVIKRDRLKLRNGVITACKKRPISIKKIDFIVDEIENELQSLSQIEIKASDVGRIVMEKLKKVGNNGETETFPKLI